MSRSSRPGTQAPGSPGCKPAGPLLGQPSRSAPPRRSIAASVSPDPDATPGRPQRRSCQRLAWRAARPASSLRGHAQRFSGALGPAKEPRWSEKTPSKAPGPSHPQGTLLRRGRPRDTAGLQRPSAACLPRQPAPTFMNSSLSKHRFSGPRGRFIFFASMTGSAAASAAPAGQARAQAERGAAASRRRRRGSARWRAPSGPASGRGRRGA